MSRGTFCEHNTKVLVKLPEGSPHYGKEICDDCHAFLRWVPRPETLENQKLRAARIARLAECRSLNDWEHSFISSVAKFKKHSPKQIAVIDRIFADYKGGGR
jgi:hypothetical protein